MVEFITNYGTILVSGTLGTLGFCLLFKIRKDKLIYGCIGGLVTNFIYCVCGDMGMSVLMQNMIPAIAATLYAEIIARVVKAPSTVFLIPAVIPLTPGGTLYYTMSAIVEGNMQEAQRMGEITLLVALGIAVGIVFISVIFYQFSRLNIKLKAFQNKPWQRDRN